MQVSRETQSVSRSAFNIPLFLSAHTAFPERARVYSSLAAVQEDFDSSSPAYKAASRYFGQELRPRTIVLGRRQVPGIVASIVTVDVGTTYSITVNGLTYSTIAATGNTPQTVVGALKSAYDASPVDGVTFTVETGGAFSLDATQDWSFSASPGVVAGNKPVAESWADSIAAVEAVNNEWIAINTESHLDADILAIAAAIEAREKVYGVSTSSPAVKTSSTTDIASQLKALGYQHTFIMWKSDADANFPEAALTGYQIQPTPGSNTWAYKGLTGTVTDNLTPTETANLVSKNVVTYEYISGAASTTGGKMVGGEYIDIMMGVLWLTARMRERVWFRLRNSSKIPYTNAGIAIIEAEIRAVLSEGVRNNFLAESPAFSVFVPDALSVDPNLRATRTLEDLRFEARLAGAIHFVSIQGSVFV